MNTRKHIEDLRVGTKKLAQELKQELNERSEPNTLEIFTKLEDFMINLDDFENVNDKDIEKYFSIEKTISQYLSTNGNNIISLNIGGKIFKTTLSTLLSEKYTYFYFIVTQRLENNEKVGGEMFFDGSCISFVFFMEYIRTKRFCLFDEKEGDELQLLDDSNFYGFTNISEQIIDQIKEIKLKKVIMITIL